MATAEVVEVEAAAGGKREAAASEAVLWEISVPCTAAAAAAAAEAAAVAAPSMGTRGDVERTNTVAAMVLVGGRGVVVGRGEEVVVVVEGMRCCVVSMVGVTWAVGAEVVWMPMGRMLAVGVVVTVGLTAAVGAVD